MPQRDDLPRLPLLLDRAAPTWIRLGVLVLVPALVLAMLLLVVAAVCALLLGVDDLLPSGWVGGIPGAERVAAGTLFGATGALAATPFLIDRWRRLRYGWAQLFEDGLTLKRWGDDIFLVYDAIDRRQVTPRGILITFHGDSRWRSFWAPTLLPTADEEEAHAVLRLLDRLAPAPDEHPGFVVPAVEGRVNELLLMILPLAPLPLLLPVALSGAAQWRAWLVFGVHAIAFHLLWEFALHERFKTLWFRPRSLVIDATPVPWSAVRRVSLADEFLVVETEAKQHGIGVRGRREQVEQLFAATSPPVSVEPELPTWARPPARRLRARLAVAAFVVALGINTALAFWVT